MEILPMEPRRIFLSHKGCDKSHVHEFKETLQLLGFGPWLDEDAMTAGRELERELFQGFRDSCAAVFFVTPAFADENFLASEINYAMQQKREKKDRFAIITLRFKDESGRQGVIPELLKQYVWKEPENDLEALREILRAVLIQVGPVSWRSEQEGSGPRATQTKSRKKELSADALELLLEASCDQHGQILVTLNSGGFAVETNGKNW